MMQSWGDYMDGLKNGAEVVLRMADPLDRGPWSMSTAATAPRWKKCGRRFSPTRGYSFTSYSAAC